MPPNGLGRGALIGIGAGAGAGRSGLIGVRGDTGEDGCAGGEYEREPRLPPLPARAHAGVATAASVRSVSRTITVVVSGRRLMRRSPRTIVMA